MRYYHTWLLPGAISELAHSKSLRYTDFLMLVIVIVKYTLIPEWRANWQLAKRLVGDTTGCHDKNVYNHQLFNMHYKLNIYN